jgi:hypothetical protein
MRVSGPRRWLAAATLVVAVLAGCGGDDDSDAGTTSVTTTPASAPSTAAPTTAAPCPAQGGTAPVVVDFPNRLSSLVGHDIRTGAHECFERVVMEFEGDGEMPGYKVEYVDDPVHLSPSDQTVDIAGDATLVVSVGAWMTTMEGTGYQGPQQIVPANVVHIRELRLIENFEGMHAWAIGLDERRSFEVSTLTDPPRIVVDVFGPAS